MQAPHLLSAVVSVKREYYLVLLLQNSKIYFLFYYNFILFVSIATYYYNEEHILGGTDFEVLVYSQFRFSLLQQYKLQHKFSTPI